jgi:hypothetical protein
VALTLSSSLALTLVHLPRADSCPSTLAHSRQSAGSVASPEERAYITITYRRVLSNTYLTAACPAGPAGVAPQWALAGQHPWNSGWGGLLFQSTSRQRGPQVLELSHHPHAPDPLSINVKFRSSKSFSLRLQLEGLALLPSYSRWHYSHRSTSHSRAEVDKSHPRPLLGRILNYPRWQPTYRPSPLPSHDILFLQHCIIARSTSFFNTGFRVGSDRSNSTQPPTKASPDHDMISREVRSDRQYLFSRHNNAPEEPEVDRQRGEDCCGQGPTAPSATG